MPGPKPLTHVTSISSRILHSVTNLCTGFITHIIKDYLDTDLRWVTGLFLVLCCEVFAVIGSVVSRAQRGLSDWHCTCATLTILIIDFDNNGSHVWALQHDMFAALLAPIRVTQRAMLNHKDHHTIKRIPFYDDKTVVWPFYLYTVKSII